MLTPSPSDVNMVSVSPSKADQHITLSLQPMGQNIDQPDASVQRNEKKRNLFFKNDTEAVFYPGQAVQVIPVDETPGKTKKVGFVDMCENPQKVVTAYKQAPEVQKIVLEKSASSEEKTGKIKKPPRLSDPTRSRNVFKRSNSDVPTSKSVDDLEATVKIEFTRDGVKVISDKESIV